MDDVLGYRRLDESHSVELTQVAGEPLDVCSGVWSQGDVACVLGGEGVQESVGEGPGSGGALGGMEGFSQETLELLYRDESLEYKEH